MIPSVPEGDTIHRAAMVLGPLLEGRRVIALSLPRRGETIEALRGRRVQRVEARGKNLLMRFEGGTVLHTHMKMNGVWRGYGPGERVPAITGDCVVALQVDGAVALCWRAPVVRFVRAEAIATDPLLGALGEDPIDGAFDPERAIAALRARGAVPLGVALMDQRAIAGIGNVWKSELCFEHRLDPFAPVACFSDDELRALLATAVRRMRGGFARGVRPDRVYDRSGRPCPRCGTAIAMKRQGEASRSTYYCATCQPARGGEAHA